MVGWWGDFLGEVMFVEEGKFYVTVSDGPFPKYDYVGIGGRGGKMWMMLMSGHHSKPW